MRFNVFFNTWYSKFFTNLAVSLEYMERFKDQAGKSMVIEAFSLSLMKVGSITARSRESGLLLGPYSLIGKPDFSNPAAGFDFLSDLQQLFL